MKIFILPVLYVWVVAATFHIHFHKKVFLDLSIPANLLEYKPPPKYEDLIPCYHDYICQEKT